MGLSRLYSVKIFFIRFEDQTESLKNITHQEPNQCYNYIDFPKTTLKIPFIFQVKAFAVFIKWIKHLIFDPSALFEERIKVFTMSQLAQWRKNIFFVRGRKQKLDFSAIMKQRLF